MQRCIWEASLSQMCREHGLLKDSFPTTSLDDLVQSSLASWRWHKEILATSKTGSFLRPDLGSAPSITKATLEESAEPDVDRDSHGTIIGAQLVPGSRFLIVLTDMNFYLYDLGPVGVGRRVSASATYVQSLPISTARPGNILRRRRFSGMTDPIVVSGQDCALFLYADFSPHPMILTIKVVKLGCATDEGVVRALPNMSVVGTLVMDSSWRERCICFSQRGDWAVFELDGAVYIWDYRQNMMVSFAMRVPEGHKLYTLAVIGHILLVFTTTGLEAYIIPPLEAIGAGSLSSLRDTPARNRVEPPPTPFFSSLYSSTINAQRFSPVIPIGPIVGQTSSSNFGLADQRPPGELFLHLHHELLLDMSIARITQLKILITHDATAPKIDLSTLSCDYPYPVPPPSNQAPMTIPTIDYGGSTYMSRSATHLSMLTPIAMPQFATAEAARYQLIYFPFPADSNRLPGCPSPEVDSAEPTAARVVDIRGFPKRHVVCSPMLGRVVWVEFGKVMVVDLRMER